MDSIKDMLALIGLLWLAYLCLKFIDWTGQRSARQNGIDYVDMLGNVHKHRPDLYNTGVNSHAKTAATVKQKPKEKLKPKWERLNATEETEDEGTETDDRS